MAMTAPPLMTLSQSHPRDHFAGIAFPHELDPEMWLTDNKDDFINMGLDLGNGKRIKGMIYYPSRMQAEEDILAAAWAGLLLDEDELTIDNYERAIRGMAEPHFQWFLTDEEEAQCINRSMADKKKAKIRRADRQDRSYKRPYYHVDFDHFFDYQIRYVYGFDSGTFLILGLSEHLVRGHYPNLGILANDHPNQVFRTPPGAVLGLYYEVDKNAWPVPQRLVHSPPYASAIQGETPSRNVAVTEVAHPRCRRI